MAVVPLSFLWGEGYAPIVQGERLERGHRVDIGVQSPLVRRGYTGDRTDDGLTHARARVPRWFTVLMPVVALSLASYPCDDMNEDGKGVHGSGAPLPLAEPNTAYPPSYGSGRKIGSVGRPLPFFAFWRSSPRRQYSRARGSSPRRSMMIASSA